ncbi:MAG: alanine racemase [Desulfobacteraceae bacterium]|nr:alanine racemase [Desulfobacteraceae bacterium]
MNNHLIVAEIDLEAIAHNVRELRRITGGHARLMIAVKADGYGHGALATARTALKNGASDLGVARIQEAIALRRHGIIAPILIFGYTPKERAADLWAYNLTASVYSLENARELSAAAVSAQKKITAHIKVDTGMGRLGLPCDPLRAKGSACADIQAIDELAGLDCQGVFTHFATSDEYDKTYTLYQFKLFRNLIAQLEGANIVFPVKHVANSGAIIDLPETHLDMVRAGICAYGLYPSDNVDKNRIVLKPAMELKTRILRVENVPKGACISYGCTYKTPAPTRIATIAAGYGDGFKRGLSNRGMALVNRRRVPVAGRVCMDLTMLDVGPDAAVHEGDEVVLIGRQGQASITADEIARKLNTVNYEIVTTLSSRVPRVYLNCEARHLSSGR